MFEAVISATIATKNPGMSIETARGIMREVVERSGIHVPAEDVSILLRQHRNLDEALKIGLARETAPVNDRYARYQRLLHQEIGYQEGLGSYSHICVEDGNESHRKIQDQIRCIVARHSLPKMFTPPLSSVRRVYAVGGLSESGKSTFASRIAASYGPACHRLKIGYFLDAASSRLCKDIYALPERSQALALCCELHAYA